VPGVSQVRIDVESSTATVSFDAGRTGMAALIKAATDAGLASSVRK